MKRQDGIRASRMDLHRQIDNEFRTEKTLLDYETRNKVAAAEHTLFLKLENIEHHPPDPFEEKKR